jgi:hypothetical protein
MLTLSHFDVIENSSMNYKMINLHDQMVLFYNYGYLIWTHNVITLALSSWPN